MEVPVVAAVKYRVLVGLSYPPDRRAEPGDIIDDLPSKSIKWLLEQGAVEVIGKPSTPTPDVEES